LPVIVMTIAAAMWAVTNIIAAMSIMSSAAAIATISGSGLAYL
jgi:hypothetical protein